MQDPGIKVERRRMFDTFVEHDVRSSIQKPRFSVSVRHNWWEFYDFDHRPKPASGGLYAGTGHFAVNGEFEAEGSTVCSGHVNGYVVNYAARYSVDDNERYEWFWDGTRRTGTSFGDVFGYGEVEIPHKWAVALRDATPPRAHEYHWSATLQEKGRILLQRYSWRELAWWEAPTVGIAK